MNQELKPILLQALRSGEYQQGYYGLRQGDKYCFLGVICDLHVKLTGNSTWVNGLNYMCPYIYDHKTNHNAIARTSMSYEVYIWAGLENGDPGLGQHYCSYWNDKRMLNLSQIADMVEELW